MASLFPSPGFRTWTQSFSLVTITSIQTETVHPTWTYTLTQEAVSTTEVLSTQRPTLFVTVSTQLSTTETAVPTSTVVSDTSTPASDPTTAPSPIQNLLSSSTIQSWYINTSSSMHIAPPLPSSSTPRYSPVETSSSTLSALSATSSPTSSNIKTTSTPSETPTNPFIGIVTSASTSNTSNTSSTHSTPKTGLIIGTIIGGCAFLIVTLLALALCIRRRRNKTTEHKAQGREIKQHLLRGDSQSSTYHPSTPSFPTNMSHSPTLQTIPRPNHNLPPAYSNPDLSLDSMYLRRERPIPDPGIRPPSPVEVSSRMASFYSSSSWDGGVGLQKYWDLERGDLSKHDSMRSNPFDLEPPPSVRSSVPPVPTPWGVKF